MFNFNIKHYDKGKLFYKFLVSILLIFTLTPITLSASTSNVIVGPISVLGEIKKSEKQILFNHFREQINNRFQLVSHKVLELISEKGLISFDIEDCNNSKCVRIVLNFLKNLREKYNAYELFLFQLVRNNSETQISIKLSSLLMPEVTKNIVNRSCNECDIEKLKIAIEMTVNKMLSKIGFKELDQYEKKVKEIVDKKSPPLEGNIEKEKNNIFEQKFNPKEKNQKNESREKALIRKESIPPVSKKYDPYQIDRDLYNQNISNFLTDVTYALQIFRSGMFVEIEVSIDPSGTVINQEIIKSSGSSDFDETAIMTIAEIKFDPLPESMIQYGNYVVNLQIHNSR